ncbi:hypothetical protein KSP40_PGU016216 [Platanthera guangdongensis]|uniref:Transposase n=1 Tax=Platanthera guangdongensis TaxID=2320717 RepID=A0ABR2LRZ0_9ASPA
MDGARPCAVTTPSVSATSEARCTRKSDRHRRHRPRQLPATSRRLRPNPRRKAPKQPSHDQIRQVVPADKEIDVAIGDTSLAAVTTSMVYRCSGC